MSNYFVNWLSACGAVTACIFVTAPAHTHTHLTALCPGLPGWTGTRKVKPIWILLKQETVSGSGISWAICKSALWSREIAVPAPHHSVFYGWVPFLPPSQQRQSTEGRISLTACMSITLCTLDCDYSMYVDYCIARLYLSVMFAERWHSVRRLDCHLLVS